MMFSSPLDLSNLGTAVGSSTKTSATSATNAEATQDRFLKLLVAQLNNQDPMNPMDNAQMTTQMTQINTVAGIESLNTTLKGMAAQYTAMQSLQGITLIGREALVAGNTFGFDGAMGKAAFRLSDAAANVQVDVVGKDGAVLDTLDFGGLTAGQHSFNWDGTGIDPNQVAGYRVRASNGGNPVSTTSFSRLTVTSVSQKDGVMQLQLQDGRTLAQDQVTTFM
ncbi:flagellar hook assembly protein FlgD [Hydrogenophaga sp. XSHU_21]